MHVWDKRTTDEQEKKECDLASHETTLVGDHFADRIANGSEQPLEFQGITLALSKIDENEISIGVSRRGHGQGRGRMLLCVHGVGLNLLHAYFAHQGTLALVHRVERDLDSLSV